MATYNLTITSKANKTFANPDLPERLVRSHQSLDTSLPAHAIRVIENYLHNSYGNFYFGAGQSAMSKCYIRVIIDIRAGSKTREEKYELMRRTLACCQEYEGKKASQCTVEVRINEIEDENVMLYDPEDAAG